jgi:hypothetical protein
LCAKSPGTPKERYARWDVATCDAGSTRVTPQPATGSSWATSPALGNSTIRSGQTGAGDLAATDPERITQILALCEDWAKRRGVIPRETVLEEMKKLGGTAFWEKDEGEET